MNSRFVPTAPERTRLRAGVMKALRYGRINAITGNELARSLHEPDDRRIRVVIRDLIREGVPVASSVVPPYGYYICANVDEAAAYIRVLKSASGKTPCACAISRRPSKTWMCPSS